MVELEAILPLIGVFVTGGIVPVVVKKMDLGKRSRNGLNGLEQKIEKLDERLRKCEIEIATLKRNNHK